MLRDEYDDELDALRNAPMGDVSDETKSLNNDDLPDLPSDEPSMDDAVERARQTGGKDNFGVLSYLNSKPPTMDDALDRARESGGKDNFKVLQGYNPKPVEMAYTSVKTDSDTADNPDAFGSKFGDSKFDSTPEVKPDVSKLPAPMSFGSMSSQSKQAEDPEYLGALKRIKEFLTRSPQDYQDIRQGLADAQAKDKKENDRNQLSALMAAAVSRRPVNYDPAATNASEYLKRLEMSQKVDDQQLDHMEKLAGLLKPKTKDAATADIQAQRDYLVKIGAATPEQVANMGPGGLKMVYEHYGLDQRNAETARKEKAKSDEEASTLAAARKQWAPLLRKRGLDPETATQKDIDRAIQENRSDATLALANKQFGYKQSEDAAKEAKAEAQDIPPGFKVHEGANPSPESRKKFTALVASQQKMKELTAAMRRELKGASLTDRMLPGEKKRRLSQLATQLRIEAKNVAELGALSGPDMGLMEAMATDPTSLSSLTGGSIESNLNGLDAWADSSVKAGSKSYGIEAMGGGGTPPKSGGSGHNAAASGPVKMKFPDGSTHDVMPEEIDLARRKGGVPLHE